MSLEFLFSGSVKEKIPIAKHPEATHLKYRSGRCLQFKVNPSPNKNMIEIPPQTNYLAFRGYDVHGEIGKRVTPIEYGEILFYDHNDNLLKVHKTTE